MTKAKCLFLVSFFLGTLAAASPPQEDPAPLPAGASLAHVTLAHDPNSHLNYLPKTSYSVQEDLILADVQDRLASIEQAGLYVLLNRLHNPDKPSPQARGISPMRLLKDPKHHRGMLLRYEVVLDATVKSLRLTRPQHAQQPYIYYVAAQIPFGRNRRMPAIIILSSPRDRLGVDRADLTGYFYMILRRPTRQTDSAKGPTELDFLVFVARQLAPGLSAALESPRRSASLQSWMTTAAGVLALLVVWIVLRRWVTRPPRTTRPKPRFPTGDRTMPEIEPGFPGQTVLVELGPRSYPMYVGSGVLSQLGPILARHGRRGRVVVVTDENVGPLYAQSVCDTLAQAAFETHTITVAPGEATKRLAVVETLYDKLFDVAAERADTVLALGGGVVGDLAGFVAATFKRGVNLVQVPTSLLAMVDSSIGGKTGVNHPRGKNMIGSFYQPRLVFADTATLRTLPPRELGCGLAETVKHAVIRDGLFFEELEQHAAQIINLEQQLMVDLVVRNCRIKADVVSADEREAGLRRILNLGHTIGHTFETVLAQRDIHHGEAVSLGMVAAARIAVQRGLLKQTLADRIVRLLENFRLPTSCPDPLPVPDLYRAMQQDKKVEAGKITFVLPTSLGACTVVDDLTETEIKAAIESLTGSP